MTPETAQQIVDKLAELQLCFATVAPRLTMNLELDRDPYYGFDTPALKLMAKYQVPVLLDSYVKIGAYIPDTARRCGFRPAIQERISSGSKLTPEQAGKYFRDFSELMSEKMSEGQPFKMAAFSVALTSEAYEKVYEKVAPILREIAKEPRHMNSQSARIIFGTVLEKGTAV